MTTDTEALICDCPAKNMPFGRCCKLEPLTALRAAFESSTNGAWAGYQAGHAAAKAETAAAVAAERERAATVCERIADDYNEREGLKYAELKTDAETGANECAAAIRAGAKERGE